MAEYIIISVSKKKRKKKKKKKKKRTLLVALNPHIVFFCPGVASS